MTNHQREFGDNDVAARMGPTTGTIPTAGGSSRLTLAGKPPDPYQRWRAGGHDSSRAHAAEAALTSTSPCPHAVPVASMLGLQLVDHPDPGTRWGVTLDPDDVRAIGPAMWAGITSLVRLLHAENHCDAPALVLLTLSGYEHPVLRAATPDDARKVGRLVAYVAGAVVSGMTSSTAGGCQRRVTALDQQLEHVGSTLAAARDEDLVDMGFLPEPDRSLTAATDEYLRRLSSASLAVTANQDTWTDLAGNDPLILVEALTTKGLWSGITPTERGRLQDQVDPADRWLVPVGGTDNHPIHLGRTRPVSVSELLDTTLRELLGTDPKLLDAINTTWLRLADDDHPDLPRVSTQDPWEAHSSMHVTDAEPRWALASEDDAQRLIALVDRVTRAALVRRLAADPNTISAGSRRLLRRLAEVLDGTVAAAAVCRVHRAAT